MPVLIMVGFRLGVFTATEIAAVAAAYRSRRPVLLSDAQAGGSPGHSAATAQETAVILLIAAAASPFSWILGIEQAPQHIPSSSRSAATSPWTILLLLNVVLLVAGCSWKRWRS